MMIAIRQALLANYPTFSLTVIERGSDEPGRIRAALNAVRMLKVWWAATWPLHLVGYGTVFVAERLSLLPSPASGFDSSVATCGAILAVFVVWVGLWIACLWRALRKQYSDFHLVTLKPWSEQVRA